jgi:methanogenic corrinoid protein MtbC1
MDRLPHESTRRSAFDGLTDDPARCTGHELNGSAEATLAAHHAWFGATGRLSPSPEERLARLVRTIEADIIPRLVQAHRGPDGAAATGAGRPASGQRRVHEVSAAIDARSFARQILAASESQWLDPIERLRSAGCSDESICLDLLAPAARELGELWTADLASFSDVTIGTGRLMQLMRRLGPADGLPQEGAADGRRVLLVAAPGEQHTFGISMVMDFFRRDGWEVVGDIDGTRLDSVALVAKEWFDVVGFSLGHVARFESLAMIVPQVRQSSRNRSIGVLVGGPVFAERPDLVQRLGADATAFDGRAAPQEANRLLAQRHRRPV